MEKIGLLRKELELVRSNGVAVSEHLIGINALWKSGIFQFLRAFGRTSIDPKTTVEAAALDGAYVAGYQDALDHIMNFKEIFLDPKPNDKKINPTFGGIEIAFERGDITKEERDGLRTRFKPD